MRFLPRSTRAVAHRAWVLVAALAGCATAQPAVGGSPTFLDHPDTLTEQGSDMLLRVLDGGRPTLSACLDADRGGTLASRVLCARIDQATDVSARLSPEVLEHLPADLQPILAEAILLHAGMRSSSCHVREAVMDRAQALWAPAWYRDDPNPSCRRAKRLMEHWRRDCDLRKDLAGPCAEAEGNGCREDRLLKYLEDCVPNARPTEPGNALDMLRAASVCTQTALQFLPDATPEEARPVALGLRRFVTRFTQDDGPLAAVPMELDTFEMREVRYRAALMAAVSGRNDHVLSWLSFQSQGPRALVKQMVLSELLTIGEDPAAARTSTILDRARTRGVTLDDVLSTLVLEIDAPVEPGMIVAWLARIHESGLASLEKPGLAETNARSPIRIGSWAPRLAPAWERLGRPDLADAAWSHWLEADPSPENLYRYGMFLWRSRRFDEARVALDQSAREGLGPKRTTDEWRMAVRAKRKELPGRVADGESQVALPAGPNRCAPYTMHALCRYMDCPDCLSLDGYARAMLTSNEGTPGEYLMALPKVLGWRLLELATDPGSERIGAVRRILDQGLPMLALMHLRACGLVRFPPSLDENARVGHVTAITGYDDGLRAFRVDDVNWASGISLLSYEDVASDVGLFLALPRGTELPPELADLLKDVDYEPAGDIIRQPAGYTGGSCMW